MGLSIGSTIISSSYPTNVLPIEDITNTVLASVNANIQTMINKSIVDNQNALLESLYPINSLYITTVNENPQTKLNGNWLLDSTIINTNGWQDYIWTNTDYIGTTQSSYTRNQWCIKDNIIYIVCGFGATSTMNSATEFELARLPIKNAYTTSSDDRIWNGAVGGAGAYNGFNVKQATDYMSVHIKPHTSANGQSSPWASTFFAIPLNDGIITNTSIITTKYIWKRIS